MTTPRRGGNGWALIAVLLVFLAANHPLVLGFAYPLWDADRQGATWQMLIADCVRGGQLLVWNPWSAGGIPEFAEPQTGALSPLAITSGFLTGGRLRGFVAYWLGLWFLGGLGLYGLGRYLGAPRWGAAVVALGYLFSGFYLGHAEHVSWIYAYSALPFIVWWFDRADRERSLRLALETGALWGLSGLGGYPGVLVITACLLPLWAIGRRLAAHSRVPSFRYDSPLRALLRLGLVAAIGLLILAPVYVGYFGEAAGFSTRIQAGGWSRELAIRSNALAPHALATFASPWLTTLQAESKHRLWPGTDVSSCSVYLGPFIPWLALLALAFRPRDRWRWWLAGLAALCLMLAVGDRLPLRGWLYDLVPPFRFFRHAAMFRGYAMFLLAVLALHGTVELAAGAGRRLRGLALALAIAGLAWGALGIALRAGGPWIESVPGAVYAQAAGWGLMVGIAFLLLAPRWCVWGVRLALVVAAVDAIATVQLGHATLYTEHPAARRTWQALEARYTPELDLLAPVRPRVLELGAGLAHNKNLPVKRPTLVNYTALINVYHDSLAAVPAVAALALGRDRTWFSAEAISVPMSDRVRDALVDRAQAGRGVPLVVHPPASMPGETAVAAGDSAALAAIDHAPAVVPAQVTLTTYAPRRLAFTATVERDGWLLVTDRWAPGWRAMVDRQPVPVWGGNAVFRALPVHAGTNAIVFDYRPAGLPLLLALSWGLLAIGLVSASGRWLLRSGVAPGIVQAGPARAPAREVSIIVPSYDAAAHVGRTLGALLEHVDRHGWDAEILVVDDGSADRTAEIVRGAIAIQGERVRLLQHERNAGKGAAVRTGMLAAHGRRRVFTDSDLPYSLQDLSAIVSALGEVEVAAGSRGGSRAERAGSRKKGAAGTGRGAASRWFSRLAIRAFRLPVDDPQCGIKGFTAEAAQRIFQRSRVNGFGFDVEALAIAQALGLRVRAVPVTLRRRAGSSVHLVRHSLQMLAELVWIRWNLRRGRYR